MIGLDRDGVERWSYAPNDDPDVTLAWGQLAALEGTVLFGAVLTDPAGRHTMVLGAVRADTGVLVWRVEDEVELSDAVDLPAILVDDDADVLFVTTAGDLRRYTTDGLLEWVFDPEGGEAIRDGSTPAVLVDGTLVVQLERTDPVTVVSTMLVAVDPNHGTERARLTYDDSMRFPPVAAGDRVVMGDANGSLCTRIPATLELDWCTTLEKGTFSFYGSENVAVDGNRIYVADDMAIRELRVSNGYEVDRFSGLLGDTVLEMAIAGDSLVVGPLVMAKEGLAVRWEALADYRPVPIPAGDLLLFHDRDWVRAYR